MNIPNFNDEVFHQILENLDKVVDSTSNMFAKALRLALTELMQHLDNDLREIKEQLRDHSNKLDSLKHHTDYDDNYW